MKKPKRNALVTATIFTDIGPVSLQADSRGLTGITLPPMTGKLSGGNPDQRPDDPVLEKAARQVTEYLQGKRTVFDLPLQLTGTEFQKKVWEVIRTIPYGRTLSYGEIAARLGGRGKARAVGGAAHANPLPLVIPCHRVIGADGSLTGFGGGLELKDKLLQLERKSG